MESVILGAAAIAATSCGDFESNMRRTAPLASLAALSADRLLSFDDDDDDDDDEDEELLLFPTCHAVKWDRSAAEYARMSSPNELTSKVSLIVPSPSPTGRIDRKNEFANESASTSA